MTYDSSTADAQDPSYLSLALASFESGLPPQQPLGLLMSGNARQQRYQRKYKQSSWSPPTANVDAIGRNKEQRPTTKDFFHVCDRWPRDKVAEHIHPGEKDRRGG